MRRGDPKAHFAFPVPLRFVAQASSLQELSRLGWRAAAGREEVALPWTTSLRPQQNGPTAYKSSGAAAALRL
jgi:hypothetical protein